MFALELGNLLNSLKHYQNYSISFNGEPENKPTKELVSRVTELADVEELQEITTLVQTCQTDALICYLAHSPTFDFSFELD